MTVKKRPANLVGPQVKKRRLELGWSQEQLAAKCQVAQMDISRASMAQIESQIRWVKDWEIVQLARVLKLPIEQLFPARYRKRSNST